MRSWAFAKGHTTRNDFVVVTDRHGMLRPSDADIALVCDRRTGVGADGFLRAIKAAHIPEWDGDPDLWFLDARHADGSLDAGVGNGLRVFVRYLSDNGLIDGDVVRIATRLGEREARVLPDGRIATTTGDVVCRGTGVTVTAGASAFPARDVVVDVPHAVVRVDEPLAPLDLGHVEVGGADDVDEVCFYAESGVDRVALRHWQRHVGASVSTGTGAVATAVSYLEHTGRDDGRVVVDLPGGWLEVHVAPGSSAMLLGPARIVARGEVFLPDQPR